DGDVLRRALGSVETQTRQPAQVVVVDDASQDGNAERVCKASSLRNIQILVLDKNSGPGAARNAGIAASSQPFIAFLDADDEWHAEKLERQISIMVTPGAPSLSGHIKGFDGMAWPDLSGPTVLTSIKRRAILASNCAPISTVIVRSDALRYRFPQTYA